MCAQQPLALPLTPSSLRLDLSRVSDDTTRSIAEKYMGVGEFVFDSTVAAAHASALFRRGSPLDDKTHGAAQEAIGAAREKKEAWFK